MILQLLHTKLSPVMAAYPLIGDIEATTPFCMYKAEAEHTRDKTGIIGYKYTVLVGIVDVTIASVNTYTASVISAMLAITGTISGTTVESVLHTSESGIYFSSADNVYINDLEFVIYTTNR